MKLTQITAITPKVRKVVEAKTFKNMFIHSLRLSTMDNDLNQKLQVVFKYYDYSNNEIDFKDAQILRINNLVTEAERVPLFAKMINVVITTIGLLQQETELESLIKNKPTPELLNKLSDVQTELGIK